MHPLMPRWGSTPGADAAAVERAYKRLIKQHHPDRAGRRCAAARRKSTAPIASCAAGRGGSDAARVQRGHSLGARAAGAGRSPRLVAARDRQPRCCVTARCAPLSRPLHGRGRRGPPASARAAADAPPAIRWTSRCTSAPIDGAVASAAPVAGRSDEMALAERQPRLPPSAPRRARASRQLDRCAAFDDAVVQLQDRDPLRDRGPFSAARGDRAAMERGVGAVGRLSGDRRPARPDPAAGRAGAGAELEPRRRASAAPSSD